MKFRTIAKAVSAPIHVSSHEERYQRVWFTDDTFSCLELYSIGDLEEAPDNSNVTDPDQLDLSALSFDRISTTDYRKLGISEKLFNKIDVCIYLLSFLRFYTNMTSETIQPGDLYAHDRAVLERLKSVMSDNIQNKDQVVAEIIALWNAVATDSLDVLLSQNQNTYPLLDSFDKNAPILKPIRTASIVNSLLDEIISSTEQLAIASAAKVGVSERSARSQMNLLKQILSGNYLDLFICRTKFVARTETEADYLNKQIDELATFRNANSRTDRGRQYAPASDNARRDRSRSPTAVRLSADQYRRDRRDEDEDANERGLSNGIG